MTGRVWLVVHVRGRSPVATWAAITDVPGNVRKAGVLEALESWPRWSSWQRRISPGSRVDVRLSGRAAAPETLDAAGVVVIPWATLDEARSRQVSIYLDAGVHAAARRAAADANLALREWVTRAIVRDLIESSYIERPAS